jgi:hypothetical protein
MLLTSTHHGQQHHGRLKCIIGAQAAAETAVAAVVLPWFVHRPSWRAIPAVGQALLCCAAAHVELLRP